MKRKWRYGLATALIAGVFAMLPFSARAEGGVLIDEKNFPDWDFRNYVSQFDKSGDGELSNEEIAAVTEIDIEFSRSRDLVRLEACTSVAELYCDDILLIKGDVSGGT